MGEVTTVGLDLAKLHFINERAWDGRLASRESLPLFYGHTIGAVVPHFPWIWEQGSTFGRPRAEVAPGDTNGGSGSSNSHSVRGKGGCQGSTEPSARLPRKQWLITLAM